MVPLLQVRYSTAEMEELAAFFSTPYEKYDAELPKIHRKTMETLNRKMRPLIRNSVERVRTDRRDEKSAIP
ncbi:MAG TPA: DUF2059 domain-containing protein [Terriglobales bacterium]|nr:DUF2059 domain-containing protein [Terriglobales bacterium]